MRRFWEWFKDRYAPWESQWSVDQDLGISYLDAMDGVGKNPRLAKDMLWSGFEEDDDPTLTWPKWSEDDQAAYEYELARDYPQ